MNKGRRVIYTDAVEVNSENIISVLQKAMPVFTEIASECSFLLQYEAGEQPLKRKKTYRKDIDVKQVDNICNEVTEFKCGFSWGNPITLIQRGEKDSGTEKESEAISLLNENYSSLGIATKQQELGRFVEICGIGYTFIDINTDWQEGDSYFTCDVLDPRCTFVVRSLRYTDRRIVLGVTLRFDELGNTYFTCFTPRQRFEIMNMTRFLDTKEKVPNPDQWKVGEQNGAVNPLGRIPIIEWIRSYDRQGCFERQIDSCDALNIMESDFVNSVDQNTQAIWHCNDVQFAMNEDGNVEHPQSNDWLQTFTTADGKTPFVTPLSISYDYAGILNNIVTQRALILQKCCVPQRNDNTGGSTGVAMSDATGWSSAENAAMKEQGIQESAKMEEVRCALLAIQKSHFCKEDNPLKKLKPSDVCPNIKRQKTYELTVKVNALATLLNSGIYGSHAIRTINLFDDPNQVWADSKDVIEKVQKKLGEEQKQETAEVKTTADDPANQITNSPAIDGMSKQDSKTDDKIDDKDKAKK